MAKAITLNPFNQNQRKLFQFGIVFLLAVFFFILYMIFRQTSSTTSSSVVLSDSKLQVFDDTYSNFGYPDRINVHYQYLLVIQPEKTLTTMYDLGNRQKKQELKQVLLDYDGKNVVYNGKGTFFNNTDLGVLCDGAFIKSDQEILCATNTSTDTSKNTVISIDTMSKSQKIVYQTTNLITTIAATNGKLYIGEMDMKTNKSYLVVDGRKTTVPTPVNLVYLMNNQVYVASFKSVFTNNKEIYYEILNNKVIKKDDKLIFLSD